MNAAAEDIQTPAGAREFKRLTLEIATPMHKTVKNAATDRETSILALTTEMYRARWMGGEWPREVVEQVLAQIVRKVDSGEEQWPADVVSSVTAQAADQGKPTTKGKA